MRRKAPLVRICMTHLPVEAERCETVADAARLMEAHQIHHVPVMSGSQLKGIISEKDILAAQIRFGTSADEKPLEAVCRTDVLTVSPVAAVDEVAEQMLGRRVDSAVVVDGGYVVGLFTTTDALRVLRELFQRG